MKALTKDKTFATLAEGFVIASVTTRPSLLTSPYTAYFLLLDSEGREHFRLIDEGGERGGPPDQRIEAGHVTAAMRAVATMSGPGRTGEDLLIHLLEDPSVAIRKDACRHAHGHANAVPALTAMLSEQQDDVVTPAMLALQSIKTPAHSAVPSLLRIAEDPNASSALRATAMGALSKIDAQGDSSTPVYEAALVGSDKYLSWMAIRSVASLRPPPARLVPALLRAWQRPSNADARAMIAYALGKIGPAAKRALPLLTTAQQSKKPQLANAARHALAKIGR